MISYRWAYFNYYNDDYYKQWWHQLFFTVTEMLSTVTIFYLVDKNNYASPRKILAIMRYVLVLRRITTVGLEFLHPDTKNIKVLDIYKSGFSILFQFHQ